MITAILGPFMLFTSLVLYLWTTGAKRDIETRAPHYAIRLYREPHAPLPLKAYPVHTRLLFFKAAPSRCRAQIIALRAIYVVHFGAVLLFLWGLAQYVRTTA